MIVSIFVMFDLTFRGSNLFSFQRVGLIGVCSLLNDGVPEALGSIKVYIARSIPTVTTTGAR